MESAAVLDVDVADVVSFPFCSVDGRTVRDRLSGHELAVNAVGAFVVGRCDGTRRLGEVVEAVSERFAVPRDQARLDTLAFIEEAERRALIRVRRSLRARLAPAALLMRALDLLLLRVRRFERRRYPASASGCLAATVWACRLPLALGLWSAPVLLYALAVAPEVPAWAAVVGALVPSAATLFVVGTIWLHELGHVLAVPMPARQEAHVMAKSLQVVMSAGGGAGRRIVVAVAGPLAGAAACVPAAAAMALAPLPAGVELVPAVVALGHLSSLLPWSHDGRSLWSGAGRPGRLELGGHAG